MTTVLQRPRPFSHTVGLAVALSECWDFLPLLFSVAVLLSSVRLMHLVVIPSLFMAAMYAAVLLLCLAAA